MTFHWWTTAWAIGEDVDKADIHDGFKSFVPAVLTVAELRAIQADGLRCAVVHGSVYLYDPTDTTTADDGDFVIVSADGKRFKRTTSDSGVEGPGSATDGHFAQFDGTSGALLKGGVALDTDGALAANSDTRLASQKAVKTYVNQSVANAVVGPASAVDARIAVFDGTSGKLIADGGKTIAGVLSDALAAGLAAVKNSVQNDGGALQLVGDTASPGNNKVYGTDGSGNRGWKSDPAGGIGANALINGSMRVAQRGTSFTSTGGANNDDVYVLDRWNLLSDGNDIVDVSQAADAPAGALFSMGLDVETVDKKFGILQIVEQNNCADLIGQTAVLSAYLKVTNTTRLDKIKMAIVTWDGTADAVTSDIVSAWGADGTNPTLVSNWTYENTPADLGVTTSWARYSVSAAIDTASAKNIGVFIWSDNVTDTDLGDFLYITNVKLELGSSPTAFRTPSIVNELDECLRYYIRQVASGAGTRIGNGTALTTTNASVLLPNLRLRASPTLFGTAGLTIADGGSNVTVTGLSLNWSGSTLQVGCTVASGLTAGDAVQLRLAGTNDYFEIMCEL